MFAISSANASAVARGTEKRARNVPRVAQHRGAREPEPLQEHRDSRELREKRGRRAREAQRDGEQLRDRAPPRTPCACAHRSGMKKSSRRSRRVVAARGRVGRGAVCGSSRGGSVGGAASGIAAAGRRSCRVEASIAPGCDIRGRSGSGLVDLAVGQILALAVPGVAIEAVRDCVLRRRARARWRNSSRAPRLARPASAAAAGRPPRSRRPLACRAERRSRSLAAPRAARPRYCRGGPHAASRRRRLRSSRSDDR